MKIEKISDNQIRCTLTSDDLASREIKLSELAYGTEKAKDLFRDMMQIAHNDFGFDADNIPLMIEAIPITPDSIVLIITKVEDPEELDTRFSKFSQGGEDISVMEETPQISGADDIIDIFQKLCESKLKRQAEKKEEKEEADEPEASVELVRLFAFRKLDDVIEASHALNGSFDGYNTLYKNAQQNSFGLVLRQSGCSPEEFNRICNMLSEYSRGRAFSQAGESYFIEHSEVIIQANALQQLVKL